VNNQGKEATHEESLYTGSLLRIIAAGRMFHSQDQHSGYNGGSPQGVYAGRKRGKRKF